MPVALPYRFDTSATVRVILQGVGGLLLVVVVGLLYSLFVSGDNVAALALLLTSLIIVHFGRLFLKNLETSRGTINSREVIAEPVFLYGIRLHSPAGRFALDHFQAVRVERIPPPMFAQGGPHERVILTGKEGTPDILVARTSDDAGRILGREMAAALGLSYEEEDAPY
jgi:hypothetical protein